MSAYPGCYAIPFQALPVIRVRRLLPEPSHLSIAYGLTTYPANRPWLGALEGYFVPTILGLSL
ncbi:hypothetical protein [Microseira sp. BLCC-F43]|uniref:hypothetical protein n=1 Tax=Microseira sp. BLCC-F43 TaxID=3153602 RepID=UPI0035BAB0CE